MVRRLGMVVGQNDENLRDVISVRSPYTSLVKMSTIAIIFEGVHSVQFQCDSNEHVLFAFFAAIKT